MTLLQHAGYETIDLRTLIDFVAGKPVDLPPRPLLLTFDDARANSWTGGDGILEELGFNAVMFVDVGRVDEGEPEYLTWEELATMQDSGRWDMQLHSGEGHHRIRYGLATGRDGTLLRLREAPRGFRRLAGPGALGHRDGARTCSPITSRRYRPLAFAPPYGDYGQDGTNDPRIPVDLLDWLTHRFDAVFTQDGTPGPKPGPDSRSAGSRSRASTTGGELYALLLSGKP